MPRDGIVLRDERGTEERIEIRGDGSVSIGGQEFAVLQPRPGEVRAGARRAWVAVTGDARWVFIEGHVYVFHVGQPGKRVRHRSGHDGNLSAPMPATVTKVLVSPSDRVREGDSVIILEAMKMELPVRATTAGVVSSVRCREGDLVQPGQELIEITPDAEAPRAGETAPDS
jgi:biotin carboxyl carrier protein